MMNPIWELSRSCDSCQRRRGVSHLGRTQDDIYVVSLTAHVKAPLQ